MRLSEVRDRVEREPGAVQVLAELEVRGGEPELQSAADASARPPRPATARTCCWRRWRPSRAARRCIGRCGRPAPSSPRRSRVASPASARSPQLSGAFASVTCCSQRVLRERDLRRAHDDAALVDPQRERHVRDPELVDHRERLVDQRRVRRERRPRRTAVPPRGSCRARRSRSRGRRATTPRTGPATRAGQIGSLTKTPTRATALCVRAGSQRRTAGRRSREARDRACARCRARDHPTRDRSPTSPCVSS